MSKQAITSPNLPRAGGPYSIGIRAGNFVFVSGQGPFNPATGKLVGDTIESQTKQTLLNVKAIVEAAGLTMGNVVKVSVFLKNAEDFQRMNEVYKTFFADVPPTRTTVAVSLVESGMLVEIDAIAYRS